MGVVTTIAGQMDAAHLRIAIVAARFNDFIVERLLAGTIDYLNRHGLTEELAVIRVPGAFELPIVCARLAKSGKYNGIIALGAVIRGATPHFDYVCAEATKGIAHVMLETGVPVGYGVLTCDTIDQAIERAGSKAGNKGWDAAAALLETIRVLEQI